MSVNVKEELKKVCRDGEPERRSRRRQKKNESIVVVMEEAEAQALVQAQQIGLWHRGFKKIGTLLLLAEKRFFICSKRTTKAQAMRTNFFICNFSRTGFLYHNGGRAYHCSLSKAF